MVERKGLSLKLELIWWAFTGILILLVLSPLLLNKVEFPFWLYNIIHIVYFITISRYIFLLKHTALAHKEVFKVIIIFLSIPVVFLLMDGISKFQKYADEIGLQNLVEHMDVSLQNGIMQYMKTEFILFGVGSVIAGTIFPFRLLISIWRGRNRGTV